MEHTHNSDIASFRYGKKYAYRFFCVTGQPEPKWLLWYRPIPHSAAVFGCRDTQTRYMELCGVTNKPYRESESALKSILTKYNTLEGNRLTLEGFLSYYRDIAVTDPRQVKNTK